MPVHFSVGDIHHADFGVSHWRQNIWLPSLLGQNFPDQTALYELQQFILLDIKHADAIGGLVQEAEACSRQLPVRQSAIRLRHINCLAIRLAWIPPRALAQGNCGNDLHFYRINHA